ncbi:MAG: rRNA pseudouridine synthase [Planctomycetota bacterium]|nr:MAG: rRNA pseudouridine synthase [Planctomycetota bacterium]
MSNDQQRVAKLMAQRGMCSRREAERLIEVGAVLVDGQVVRTQGVKAAPDAEIRLSPHGSNRIQAHTSILLHKPMGIVSTQPEDGQTAAWQLLSSSSAHGRNDAQAVERVLAKPWTMAVCGRLDRDSRGLLILTQNGVLAKTLTGSRGVEKRYLVSVDRHVNQEHLQRLRGEWSLDGHQLLPMRVEQAGPRRLRFVLREGRKHQIRRVCAELELRVVDLLREAIGPWSLGSLPEGKWSVIDPQTVQRFIDEQHHGRGR